MGTKQAEERQEMVLRAIEEHWAANHVPPTIRDVCRATGINSTSYVQWMVRRLVKRGRLVWGGSPPKPVPIWVRDAIDGA